MQDLLPGANAAVSGLSEEVQISYGQIPGADIDISAFLISATGKVRSDEDMCFYGQPSVEKGAVEMTSSRMGNATFRIDPSRLPADVDRVVFTATIHENRANFSRTSEIRIDLPGIRCRVPCAGMTETALILAEIYRRNAQWKVRVVGQGFNGGLAALATHLGVQIEAPAPVAAEPQKPASRLRLEKKLIDLEKKDPAMVSLVKKVQVSLEKKGITRDRAKVCLCLDISGSMDALYRSGKIDTLVQRVMALGYRFDDDGEIDVFLFGVNSHEYGTVGIDGYKTLVAQIRSRYALEGGTRYGKAMGVVREFYRRDNPEGLPVYVMFVTDGATDDKPLTERMLKEASAEPIFWKFMGIVDPKGFYAAARLEFLERLDDLTGRVVDNADFFQVKDPAGMSDEEMFDAMMNEYQGWCVAAAQKGILK